MRPSNIKPKILEWWKGSIISKTKKWTHIPRGLISSPSDSLYDTPALTIELFQVWEEVLRLAVYIDKILHLAAIPTIVAPS